MSSLMDPTVQEDDPMVGANEEEEGEGDVIMPGADDDSSEEEEDDNEDEAKRIAEGFLVDDDEEDEDEDEDADERRRRKRRKRHHRRKLRDQEEGLEDDDLELLEENTGTSFKRRGRLTRLRRGHDSESPPAASSSRHAARIESSDDDLDTEEPKRPQDIHGIFDRDDDDDDSDSFIESDDDQPGDEEARAKRRREKRKLEQEYRQQRPSHPLAGIDSNAWDEIHEIFGDGRDYEWAMELDGDEGDEEDQVKPRFTDVFEPAEIRTRLLTEDDNLIRVRDVPERLQLSSSFLAPPAISGSPLSLHEPLTQDDLNAAFNWVHRQLPVKKTEPFLEGNELHHLNASFGSAINFVIKSLFIDDYEVPYIWTHKRDHLSHFDVHDMKESGFDLLSLPELWRIYALGRKYRSLLTRKRALVASFERLQVEDEYFTDQVMTQLDTVDMVADAAEWLNMKYKDRKGAENGFHFHDDEPEVRKHKAPSRVSAYDLAKKSIASRLANAFGIQSHEVCRNFLGEQNIHFVEEQELHPLVLAEQFVDPDPAKGETAETLLARARLILATEIGKDPLMRQQIRTLFKDDASIYVEPTPKGLSKISEYDPEFSFKYLRQKPISYMLESSQYLQILAAEEKGLVKHSIVPNPDSTSRFEGRLRDSFNSDGFTDAAKAWNEERGKVIRDVMEQHLLPAAVKWTREYIREECEDHLATRAGAHLRSRVDLAPYTSPNMNIGDTPSVLALSWGKGDPQKDAIALVYLDQFGRMREHTKLDNLVDAELREEFQDLVTRRKPDVIVLGGFSMATTKLSIRVKDIVYDRTLGEDGWSNGPNASDIPIVYLPDQVARIFQHSSRALEEFGSLPETTKYCIGLARMAQNPLNEYAALGEDIIAINFDDSSEDQALVPREKLLAAYERVLVDVVNKVGVDINRAVADPYHRHLLPFVCGLGPRKARALVEKIGSMGGAVVNRQQFIKADLLTSKVFLNAVSFLRIHQEEGDHLKRPRDDANQDKVGDPLDDTRIHIEDYDLARKMATDALELDEEDIHDEHPSAVVQQIMTDKDGAKKLGDLNLDEFAISLFEASEDKKRHTLTAIRDEISKPYAELRDPIPALGAWEVLTTLSGESHKTLRSGLILAVMVQRVTSTNILVRLGSGIEGSIDQAYLAESGASSKNLVQNRQSIQALVLNVNMDLQRDFFHVEMSTRERDVTGGDFAARRVRADQFWDYQQHEKDVELQRRKKQAEVNKTRRIIKHPNFHDFNTAQAEAYLDKQQRGDVVIRPSSKGLNHLAVTWKVDDKLYQHIDVVDANPNLTGQTVGSQLIVDATHTYADLDELIVNHVQAMARRVEELVAHERFKPGAEDELHLWLKNRLAADPGKSMYGFTLNRKKPGHFNLGFLANKSATIQTWPVRVTPEAYYLFEAAAVGVPELCDAFKVRHLHESQSHAAATAGGKTPYGAGGRTPGRPGHATPGHASVRQPARTPNPYQYGGATPAYGAPPGPPVPGYQTPSHHPPAQPGIPHGMNPQRAAMINNNGGWGQSGWS